MRIRTILMAGACVLLGAGTAAAGSHGAACTYSVDPAAIKVEWTAFKLTEKVGVTGTFNEMKASGPAKAGSLAELARGLRMEIDGTSIESGNPGRNATVSEFFFQQFKPSAEIVGQAVAVQGDDQSGVVTIEISLNGVTRPVGFAYTIGDGGAVEARGSFDMMDFALIGAYDTLHKACEEKHTGEDGVSKTWTDVDVRITGAFEKSCS